MREFVVDLRKRLRGVWNADVLAEHVHGVPILSPCGGGGRPFLNTTLEVRAAFAALPFPYMLTPGNHHCGRSTHLNVIDHLS
eukprot:1161731-Pelagomonas_calceolata.AAC.1